MNEIDFPDLYQAADQLSRSAQTRFFSVLFLNLVFLVVAAILSVYNQPHVGMAYAQVVVLFLSLGCTAYLGYSTPEKKWYGGRALAESVKTISWRYMVRAEPFDKNNQISRSIFISTLSEILEANREISREAVSDSDRAQITGQMSSIRETSLEDRKKFYLDQRVTDQLGWYNRKALFNRRRADLFFGLLCVANIVAIAFAISKVRSPSVESWPTDIFVAIAASLLAWTQAKRYRELSASYKLAAHEISLIREKLALINTEKEFSLFIGDAENAFSREHTQWVARRDL